MGRMMKWVVSGLLGLAVLAGGQAQEKPLVLYAEDPETSRSIADNAPLVLGQAYVQSALELTEQTKQAYRKLYVDLQAKFESLIAQNKEIDDAEMDKMRLETDHAAVALLSPGQAKRLQELSLQAFGLEAFNLVELRQDLRMTSEQQKLVDKVLVAWSEAQEAYSKKVTDITQKNDGSESDPPQAIVKKSDRSYLELRTLKPEHDKLTKLKATLTAKLMEYLDQDQKKTYASMLGTRVKVEEP